MRWSAAAVQRIVLTRPAVEAGERLGFLPGDLTQKVDPYLRPLYDALYDLMGFDRVHQGLRAQRAGDRAAGLHARAHAEQRLRHPRRGAEHHARADEDVPHPHRLRRKRVVTGDVSQIDLPKQQLSGLIDAERVLKRVKGIATRTSPAPTWCGTRWWRASSMPTTPRASAMGRTEMAAGSLRSLSLQFGDFKGVPRHRAALPRHSVARWIRHGAGHRRRDHGAHRRRRRRPALNRSTAARTTRPTC
jgi:hypothetical protein